MLWLIGLRDLQWGRRRFAIGVVATALVFAVGLLMSGVSASFDNEVDRTVSAFEADGWLVRKESFGPFTGPATIPASSAHAVRAVPGVVRADPVAILRATTETPKRANVNLIGVVPGGVGSPAGWKARLLARGGAIVDASLGLDVGDRLDLNGAQFTVGALTTGQTYFAGIPTVTLSLRNAQRLGLGRRDLATAVLTQGRPSAVPPGLSVLDNHDVAVDLGRPVAQAKQTIAFIKVLLWLVAAGIIGAVVYLSVLERVRDLAALKAIGVGTGHLVGGLIVQASLLSLLAALVSVVIEAAIEPAVAMSVEVPALTFMTFPAVAVVVGIVASLIGLRRAIAVDPALAFAGSR